MKEKEILAILCGDAQPHLRDMAWRTLYNHTHDKIVGQMRNIYGGSIPADIFEDIYADACIDMIENARKGKISSEGGKLNLPGYLYTLCMRKCYRKKGKADAHVVSFDDPRTDVLPSKDDIFGSTEDEGLSPEDREFLLNLLLRALESMPENCRMMFRQFYWEKKTMAEIALMLGLRGPDSAKTTKNRCMDKYRKMVKTLVKDDDAAEEFVRDTVERDCLKAMFSEYRDENLVAAALCDPEDGKLLPEDIDWDAELNFN